MNVRGLNKICIAFVFVFAISFFGVIMTANSYGATFMSVNVNGECENGYIDDEAAYYTFNLPQNGLVRIGVSSDGNVYYDLSDEPDFSTIISSKGGYANLPAGDYYIKVDGVGEYSVAVNFEPLIEYDQEPNDNMSDAINMVSGKTYKGHAYFSFRDRDWYRLEVMTQSIIHFYIDQPSGVTGFLYDDNGKMINFIEASISGLTHPFYRVDPGVYYIQIVPDYMADNNYIFSARIVEYPTVNEISSVVSTGIGAAKISWTESKYAEGYLLFKEPLNGGSWSYVATLPAGTLSYVDRNAPYPGYGCIYHVCGYRYDAKDPYNPNIEILSEEDNEGTIYNASVPSNVKTAKINGNTIKVSWANVPGVAGYKIYRKANGGNFVLVKTVKDGKSVYWNDTTVKKGVNYTYKVRSYITKNGTVYNSKFSLTSSAKLTGTIAAPGSVKVKTYSSYNKLSWNKIRTATGYKIYRKAGNGVYKLVKTTTSANSLVYNDKNVKKGIKYTYKIKAYYKDYTYNSELGKYTFTNVFSKYSNIVSIKR